MNGREDDGSPPVGAPLPGWQPRPWPPRTVMAGHYCRMEPLAAEAHAEHLYRAYAKDPAHRVWTYLPYGPFASANAYAAWVREVCARDDPLFHAVVDSETGRAAGVASYLRIQPDTGVIEVGHINFSPRLQRTAAATEAMYLMMRRALGELGYRRYEWKCDALNAASRRAAERLGFVFEGVFRQATIYKGRNRDTAWYSVIDAEWPALGRAYEAWLDPANFDAEGRQRSRLAELTARARSDAGR